MEQGQTYKVLELEKYGGELSIKTRSYRKPNKGEVAIRVHCSTIHPADGFVLLGAYGSNQPKLPIVPGMEGSGEIVECGEGVDQSFKGRRCCFAQNASTAGPFEGAWSQIVYVNFNTIMPFEGEIDYEQICFSFVNPVTAAGFVDTVEKKGEKVAAQNAGNSTVGRIFIRFCKLRGIKTINLVRKKEQIDELKTLGADYVLSTSEPGWDVEFKKLAAELNVQSFFECVGGEMTGTVLSLLPPKATVYHYGNLEFRPPSNISTGDLIFHAKKLEGWWLSTWMMSVGPERFITWIGLIISEIQKGSDLFKTQISKRFKLEEIDEARKLYSSNMSAGKVIINPNN